MKNWKAIFGVVIVFLLGMAAGGLLTVGVILRQIEGGPQVRARLVERRLSRQLRLDTAQREQLRTIIANAQNQMRDARQQIRPQVEAIFDEAVAKERETLRPDQREKFDRIVAASRERWKQLSGSP